MNINTRAKALIGAVAIGGAAIAMGGAFTAGGLAAGTDVESKPVFIGGQITQTVEGATLAGVVYGFDSTTDPKDIETVTLNFDAGSKAKDKTPTIVVGDDTVAYECEAVGNVTDDVSVCVPATPGTFAGVGISNLVVTVPSSNVG